MPNKVVVLINEKLCRCRTDETWRHHQGIKMLGEHKGVQSVFLGAMKGWYDPKYGMPKSYEAMNPDHRAEVEHNMVKSFMLGDDSKRWEVIGRITLNKI